MEPVPYQSVWDLTVALRSRLFHATGADTWHDRDTIKDTRLYVESNLIQSNARLWLGHCANGTLRFAAMPTRVFPAATARAEWNFGPGMYYSSDMVMLLCDLRHVIELEDGRRFDLDARTTDSKSWYADHHLPVTTGQADEVAWLKYSAAPVAADASAAPLSPAPLPGLPGLIHGLALRNEGSAPLRGRVLTYASKRLINRYEDLSDPVCISHNRVETRFRENSVILCVPYGCAGLHVDQGQWIQVDGDELCAERSFEIAPGQQESFDAYVALGLSYGDIMPTFYALYGQRPLTWLNKTASFWRDRLGVIETSACDTPTQAEATRDIYIRALFDNLNCVQLNENGDLLSHMQGAPSHRYGTIWGIDWEPTAVSLLHLCPEMTERILLFIAGRSRVPAGDGDPSFSLPIYLAPLVIARKYVERTGDVALFARNPQLAGQITDIARGLIKAKHPDYALFPTLYSSDGTTGMRYDYATNLKVWYALNSMAYLQHHAGLPGVEVDLKALCAQIKTDVSSTMTAQTGQGLQITGGTNLDEEPGEHYLPNGACYYDGEDTASMLAPVLGFSGHEDEAWRNMHRFARTLNCATYDPEYDALLWTPSEPLALDGTGFVSRLFGSVARGEMAEAASLLWRLGTDDASGSVYWWPAGYGEKRGTTKCSQGQGAYVWQYAEQWLGIKADAPSRTLSIAPLGLPTTVRYEGYRAGGALFDLFYEEKDGESFVSVRSHAQEHWTLNIGLRSHGAGAQDATATRTMPLPPGALVKLKQPCPTAHQEPFTQQEAVKAEAQRHCDPQGVGFLRYGGVSFKDGVHFERHTAPLELRFCVINATGAGWQDVAVTLALPEGVQGSARKPGWRSAKAPPPFKEGPLTVAIGSLPAHSRAVAPFSVERPVKAQYERVRPMHCPSQPDQDVVLSVRGISHPVDHCYTATLTARTAGGVQIMRRIPFTVSVRNLDSQKELILDD